VNGPGEAKQVTVGLTGGSPNNLVYVDGKPDHKMSNEDLVDGLEKLIREKVSVAEEQAEQQRENVIARS
jgi:(E)-4-hydroxy-3-methylbut-2-enyl-diphosphate synthase